MELSKSQQISVIIMLILSIVYFIALNVNFFQRANFLLFDWQSTMLAEQFVVDDDIIVIAIDDYSLTKMSGIAGRWPWPRTVHGQVLASLNEFSPATTAFDILFADKDIYRPDADLYFNEVLAQSPNVYLATLEQNISQGGGVLVSQLPEELALIQTKHAKVTAKASFVLPMAINQSNWQLGSINFTANLDGVGRYYDVYRNSDGWHMPSLPSKIISALNLPLPDRQRILLQWRGNIFQPYKTLSYADVYTAAVNQDQQFLKQFNDKVILIGVTASGLFDARSTPLTPHLPGVYILATAIDNLKNQTYLTPVKDIAAQLLVVLIIVMFSSCFNLVKNYAKKVSISFFLLVLFSIALIFWSNTLMKQQQILFVGEILIFMLVSFISLSFVYGYIEYRHRQEALAMFSRFLEPSVVYKLLKDDALLPEKLNKKDTLTVLFSDIRGFTDIAENRDAQTLVNLLNDYFNQQVNIIFSHKGTLDKFIGDCIMAFWGAPEVSTNHATNAIHAALAMELQLVEFKKKLPANLQHFDIGIGIHTGECIVGMIGAKRRLDYTVVGDAVNLTSRIEGLTKYSARILISEQTKLLAEDDFDFIYQGEHKVKGRRALVKLYQPQHKVTSKP
jgi:adenylate cyclase